MEKGINRQEEPPFVDIELLEKVVEVERAGIDFESELDKAMAEKILEKIEENENREERLLLLISALPDFKKDHIENILREAVGLEAIQEAS